MLEIRNAAGQALELPADQRLAIEINSTIFDADEVLKGSYSYPFKFGLTPQNCRFIQNSHLPESPAGSDIDVSVRSGPFQFQALLTFKTQGKEADAALLIDLGQLADKIRNVPLREFVTESIFVSTNESSNDITMLKLATAAPNQYACVFPPFFNPGMIPEDFVPVDDQEKPTPGYKRQTLVNACYPGTTLPTYSDTQLGSGDRLIVPFIYVGWLITHICGKLGFSASGSFFTDPELSRLVIYNTQTIPGLDTTTGGYTVQLGRHLGTESIADFFKALRAYIGLSIDINVSSSRAVFNTYRAMSQSREYVDISDSIVPGSTGVAPSEGRGYKVNVGGDSADDYVTYWPFPYDSREIRPKELRTSFTFEVGSKENEISLGIGTVRMDTFKNTADATPAGPSWLIPAANQAGNLADPFFEKSANYSPYFDADDTDIVPPSKNPWAMRVLIYWGLQEDSAGKFYPYASSVSYDSKYRVFGGLSLQPGEPDDIWNRHQKAYFEFLASSKKVTVLNRLPLSKLAQISPSTPIGFKLDNQVLGKYLLERLRYELPAKNGYVLAEFEGRQLSPKTLRPAGAADARLVNCWIQLKLVNRRSENNPQESRQFFYGDLVAVIWQDGLFEVPETTKGFLFEYRRTVVDYDVNGMSTKKSTKEAVYIQGHETTIESNYNYLISGNPRGLIKEAYWAPLDGEGYRTR